jgi:hypothetical protein
MVLMTKTKKILEKAKIWEKVVKVALKQDCPKNSDYKTLSKE